MAERKALTKKIRFEVFKRDSFKCQYCGRKAPDVLLHIDHIVPIAKGGTNDLLNLITSCADCNSGKSDRQLSDTTVIDKQRQQLEDLQERKEQIELMFEWQKGLLNLDDDLITELAKFWAERNPGFTLNDNGLRGLKSLKRKFEIGEIIEAMKAATEQYVEYIDGRPTHESVELAWKRIGGICNIKRQEKDNPALSRIYYIRGILRNRLSYCNENVALKLLKEAIAVGATLESLERHAKEVRNWSQWRSDLEELIRSLEKTGQSEAEENEN